MILYENSVAYRLAELRAMAEALSAMAPPQPDTAWLPAHVWPVKEPHQQANFLSICDALLRDLEMPLPFPATGVRP